MSSAVYPRRAAASLGIAVLALALFALPADAQRLRKPSSSLQLAVPTVTCGASPTINLTWTDSASTTDASYRVMSKGASAKATAWTGGASLGNVRAATVPAANGSAWSFAIEAVTTTTRHSNTVNVTVSCAVGDTTDPSTPASMTATVASCSSVNLAWAASTDEAGGSGLRGYRLYRNGALVKTVLAPSTSTSDTSLAGSTVYAYEVAAIDVASNESAHRAAPSVTTPQCPNAMPNANAGPDRSTMTLNNLSFNGSGSTDPDGSIVGYSWSWGDGTGTATGMSPSHTYTTPGTYTVTLTVTDDRNGTDTDSASVTVNNRAPNANAGADKSATAGQSLGFDGSASTDLDGIVVSHAWNYGDGTNGTGAWATHTYGAAGTYTVTLTATDNLGATDTDTAVVTVGQVPNVSPIAEAGSNTIAALNSAVNVSGAASSDPDGSLVSYAWNWGDGSANASGVNASHTYGAPGTYTITLTVTDNRGATASDTLSVTVANAPPVAAAGPDRSAGIGATLSFSGSGSSDSDGSIASYVWSWGDGSANSSGVNASHAFATAGTYTVTLTVTDNFGTAASDTARVTVANTPPVAAAGADRTTPTLSSVAFSGSASNDPDGSIVSYVWNWGDGTTNGNGLSVNHAFATAGTYTVTLTVTDNHGATASDSAVVSVTNRAPTAAAGQDVTTTTGTTIGFSGAGSADADGSLTGYAWNWGDGSANGTGAAASHSWSTAGTYTVTLIVSDNNGATASDTATVTVNNPPPPPPPPSDDVWAKRFGGANTDAAGAVAHDPAGNAYVTGNFYDTTSINGVSYTSAGSSDIWVAKIAPSGSVLWVRTIGGPDSESPSAIEYDGHGSVILTSSLNGTVNFGGGSLTSAGGVDFVVAKLDAATGAHQWSKRFGGTANDNASAVAVDADGNVFVTGYFIGSINMGGTTLRVPFTSDLDLYILKLDANGNHVWSKNFPNDANDSGTDIAVDANGNVVVTGSLFNSINFSGGTLGGSGTLTSPMSLTDIVVAKFTNAGAYVAATKIGSPTANDGPRAIGVDSAGNVYALGSATAAVDAGGGSLPSVGGSDALLVKLRSSDLGHIWSKRPGASQNDYGLDLEVADDGDVVIVGVFTGTMDLGNGTIFSSTLNEDAYALRYTSGGSLVGAKQFGGLTNQDRFQGVAMSGDHVVGVGYFYNAGVYGSTTLTSAGMADAVIARFSL